jgi:hypothetical protein
VLSGFNLLAPSTLGVRLDAEGRATHGENGQALDADLGRDTLDAAAAIARCDPGPERTPVE